MELRMYLLFYAIGAAVVALFFTNAIEVINQKLFDRNANNGKAVKLKWKEPAWWVMGFDLCVLFCLSPLLTLIGVILLAYCWRAIQGDRTLHCKNPVYTVCGALLVLLYGLGSNIYSIPWLAPLCTVVLMWFGGKVGRIFSPADTKGRC